VRKRQLHVGESSLSFVRRAWVPPWRVARLGEAAKLLILLLLLRWWSSCTGRWIHTRGSLATEAQPRFACHGISSTPEARLPDPHSRQQERGRFHRREVRLVSFTMCPELGDGGHHEEAQRWERGHHGGPELGDGGMRLWWKMAPCHATCSSMRMAARRRSSGGALASMASVGRCFPWL
jgi:hypothetical protein